MIARSNIGANINKNINDKILSKNNFKIKFEP